MGRPVGIVPHTHWDREWHEPYQVFRARLVRLLDELLALLERDRSYARFLLDGQTVVVDDYLEVRPEAEDAIRRLVAEGRLSLGPWMVLMDELMVSGETIVRDLQLGTARAAELGGAMPVGYLPDMFGHVAQMPQILRLAGLDHAVVWRGVPSEIDRTAFWWEAPDGSRVRAEYLYGSYSNGRDLPDDAVALVARARGYEHELGPVALPGGGLLLMNGTDHQLPQPWLGRVVTEANALQDDYELAVTSLPEYLAAQPVDGLPTWRGELRSGARANVLMGVASNRVDVHRAAAAAERAIERRAEPLTALFASDDTAARRLLGQAWRRLVENSAHDSSCACSHDDVVDQVVVRYREARQIGDVLTRDALHRLAAEVDAPPGSTVVVNPTAADRGGLVEVRVPGEGPVHLRDLDGGPCPAQVVATGGGEGFHAMVEGRKIRWVLDTMRGPELAGTTVTSYEVGRDADGRVDVRLQGAGPGDEPVDLEGLREELMALGEAGASFRVRLEHAPSRVVVFVAPPVPGFGWRTFVPVEGDGPSTAVSAGPEAGGGVRLDNERLAVTVDPDDGTITLVTRDGVRVEGANRYVDGGDGGDTYNYSPPDADVLVDRPESVTARVTEVGPVRARALVEAVYRWPTHAIGDERSCRRRSEETAPVTVRTTLELRAGEPFLRVRCELDNVCRDHRLRAHFPLPARADGSDAECAFAVVHRGLSAEGGPHEHPLPTFVSRRFVDAGGAGEAGGVVGLAVLHDGLLEYEVTGDGTELALTLLRATGYLSRTEPAYRPNPAGPAVPVRGAQMPGPRTAEYALLPHRGDWRDAASHRRADELLVPLERVRGGGWTGAWRPPTGRELEVRGAEVSAVTRDEEGLVVRVFSTAPAPASVSVTWRGAPATGRVVDLLDRPVRPFTAALGLRPGEIATLRLDEPA